MDENTQVMTPEATTPEEPVTTPADVEPAEPTVEAAPEEPTEVTTPPPADEETADTPPAPFLPVKFRHEHRDLTREEATTYAQLGLKYEAEQPMRDTLELMAAGRGQSVPEFVESWARAEEQALLRSKLEITNGNEEAARQLVKAEMDARREARNIRAQQVRDAEQQAEQTLSDRLAAEFAELAAEFPELSDISTVPQAVVEDAVQNGRHLYDAYLRYQRQEGKKIEQNRAAQEAAAVASTGSLADTPPEDAVDAATAAMLAGLRSVLD